MAGGWAQTREVIDIPAVPVQATEQGEQRRTPRADLAGVALGKQRLGINLVSLSLAAHRTIQWYLQTVHQLSLRACLQSFED